jgi:regulator of replication initiation timing
MTLPSWEKFLRQNSYLKDLLDDYDKMKEDYYKMKEKLRRLEKTQKAEFAFEADRLRSKVNSLVRENMDLELKISRLEKELEDAKQSKKTV